MIATSTLRRFPLALGAGAVLLSLAASALAVEISPPPALTNKAYVLMEFDTGQILASSNPDVALPPASLTKMMTSYIVEQSLKSGRLKPTDQVRVSLNAWCRGSSTESCMYLPLNSSASVMDMLRGIIIQSGNDASKAVAEHLGGSEPAFAQTMNAEAKRLGMINTHFENATGLPAPTHKASARDLAILARAIIRDSADYYPIYAEKDFKFNGIKQGNRNALLYTDPTVDGLKTGHTEDAGFCLTASAKRSGMRLISVVMGTSSMQDRADQTRALFNWGFSSFEKAKAVTGGAALASAPVQFGKADVVQAGVLADWNLMVPRGQASQIKTAVQLNPEIKAPVAQGAVIGKVVATIDGKSYGEQNLVALQPVEKSGFFLNLWQHIRKLFK
ncbi:MAG: D-alanyl-D-alanine carboxypeptidase [Aquabacterium sp.]|uniref:D-alanyl-D-alanine carboxypeptidase family protein n=1 Tax=Aquabacterium sp. TaxID=1872578 RepID=UPI00120975AB|nr:D-alanyl-D-alanine carboxypeptidase family protein [Aquabacterium sp.]TAK91896.1 MAG: D-alanyl-D-alanine carboxypeptidase [Aquabacterium sp.]